MMKGLNRFIKTGMDKTIEDIDFHEFYHMMDQGLTQMEIAEQLGITERAVGWLVKEIEKDV
jgi:DNA-binding transcriptional regulator LsrR (DeoR family)